MTPAEVKPEDALIYQKLQAIQIPELIFRDANIHDVVEFLVMASREGDSDPQNLAVNIVLDLGERTVPGISFSARKVSLLDAIKIVTEVADLRYRIENNAIVICSPTDLKSNQ